MNRHQRIVMKPTVRAGLADMARKVLDESAPRLINLM